MATPKNIWNNSTEMHELISKEPDSYFHSPEPKKLLLELKHLMNTNQVNLQSMQF